MADNLNKNTILFYQENIIDNVLFYLEKFVVFNGQFHLRSTIIILYDPRNSLTIDLLDFKEQSA